MTTDKHELQRLCDLLDKALGRAYSMGQTYWAQADSESYRQNLKSGETQAMFDDMRYETVAKLCEALDHIDVQAEQLAELAAVTAERDDLRRRVDGMEAKLCKYIGGECTCPPDRPTQATHYPSCPTILKKRLQTLKDCVYAAYRKGQADFRNRAMEACCAQNHWEANSIANEIGDLDTLELEFKEVFPHV